MRLLRLIPLLVLAACASRGADTDERCRQLLDDSRRYSKVQEYELATDCALQARELAAAQGLRALEGEALCQLSDIDLMTWRDEQAWGNACEAEKIARELDLDTILTGALINKGKVCLFSGITPEDARDDEALAFFQEARAIADRGGELATRVNILCDISQVFINKNRFNDPIDPVLYKQAGDYLARGEDLGRRGGMLGLDAKVLPIKIRYLRQGGRIDEAIECCNNVLSITPEKDYLQQEQAYYQLVMLHAAKNDAKQAAAAHQQYVYANEHYMKQKADNLLQEMETRYKSEAQQRIIAQRRIQIILLLVAVLLLAGLVLETVLKNRQIRRQNEALSESNANKDKLLGFISRDLANPDFNQDVQEMAKSLASMSEDEIRDRCTTLMQGSDELGGEVANYIGKLMEERKRAGAKIGLTARELEIIRLSCDGLAPADIAEKLHISVHTVNNHKQNIYAKMGVGSNAEMLRAASSLGLV